MQHVFRMDRSMDCNKLRVVMCMVSYGIVLALKEQVN